MSMKRELLNLGLLVFLSASSAAGGGGLFIVDGVPQRHAGLASEAYVDAHVPALSVLASNATRLIQIDTQAWVTVVGGTGTLWQVVTSTQLVCSGAGTLAVNGRYAGSVESGYFENTTNADLTVIGEDDSWFVYDQGGGGWLYHCFGSESPVGGAWVVDAGAAPAPSFWLGEVSTTNAYPLARMGDLGPYCTTAQLMDYVATNDPCTYPVLVLSMGGQWTDFELKASTNNFATLVYCVWSIAANPWADDPDVAVYFADDYAADQRQWHKAAVATPIMNQLADPGHSEIGTVVVSPSHGCVVPWQQWMSRTNDRLVWSYIRFDGVGYEMNATGTQPHWNPVVPVEWRKARIAP